MGLLKLKTGDKEYHLELDLHTSRRKTELPVEDLHAVFMENLTVRGTGAEEINHYLNSKKKPKPRWFETPQQGTQKRIWDIVQRAKKSGTEIWFGDVEPTGRDSATASLLGSITGAAELASAVWLGKKGIAKERKISRFISSRLGRINPIIAKRDKIMAHKIMTLAENTGHNTIGIYVGAGHVGMADILEKGTPLTERQRAKIAKRGPDALKMFRCIYDREVGRWRVEEHSL